MSELVRTYYTNGNILEEYYMFNGKKEGEFKSYWDNGQLWEVCNYINGIRQ